LTAAHADPDSFAQIAAVAMAHLNLVLGWTWCGPHHRANSILVFLGQK
jgi:hypothetical protein